MKEVFKVSSKTEPGKLAGAMAGVVKNGKEVSIQAIGARAVNQAVKAVAIARGFLAPAGIDVAIIPSFKEQEFDERPVTAMRLEIIEVEKI